MKKKSFTKVVNVLFYHSTDGKTGIAGLPPCCIAEPAIQSSSPGSESSAFFVNHPVFVFCSRAVIKCIYTIPNCQRGLGSLWAQEAQLSSTDCIST